MSDFIYPSDADRAENDELNRACEYIEQLEEKLDICNERRKHLYDHIRELQDVKSDLEDQLDTAIEVNKAQDDESRCVWFWQGDGSDNLDSMISRLPIVITAGQLKDLIAAVSVPGLPPKNPDLPTEEQGLFNKFLVRRVDGEDQPGCKHYGCRYFVLDVDHDKFAPIALGAYAEACHKELPKLASDLVKEWNAKVPRTLNVV